MATREYAGYALQEQSDYASQRHSHYTPQRQSTHALQQQAAKQVSPKTAASWCSWTPGRVKCMHSVIAAAVAEADACISSASAPDFSHLQRHRRLPRVQCSKIGMQRAAQSEGKRSCRGGKRSYLSRVDSKVPAHLEGQYRYDKARVTS